MKNKLDAGLIEDVLFFLSKQELYEAQTYFALLSESLGLTEEMLDLFLIYLNMTELALRRGAEAVRGDVERKGLSYISIYDEAYPALLREIVQPPLLLYYRGDLDCLKHKTLSIVGARKPSFDGIRACDGVIANLAACIKGLSIVSGLALGVDSLVHKASLKYGFSAISVLPGSVDAPTPSSNVYLAEQILDHGGLLLSEKAPGYRIKPYSYLERNRIISGISTKTLIVEAALKSGSLATARLALEQGRDVYAMPGSLSNPVAEGCNYLIAQGAYPLYKLDALLEDEEFRACTPKRGRKKGACALPVELVEDELLTLIRQKRKMGIEELREKLSLGEAELFSKLVEYELEGFITRDGESVLSL